MTKRASLIRTSHKPVTAKGSKPNGGSRMTVHFEWRSEYQVDGGVIDEEHQTLFALANRVIEKIHPETERADIIETVKALYRYMETHFDHEQDLMEKAHYPGIEEHVRQHQRILSEMNDALRTQNDMRKYGATLRRLMLDWVLLHIVEEDRQIAKYVKAHISGAPITKGDEQQ